MMENLKTATEWYIEGYIVVPNAVGQNIDGTTYFSYDEVELDKAEFDSYLPDDVEEFFLG